MTPPDFLSFWTDMLAAVSGFLLTPPMIWFTAIILLFFVGRLVQRIIN